MKNNIFAVLILKTKNMNVKIIGQALYLIFFVSFTMAQVKIEKPLDGVVSNKDILVQAAGINEVLVEQFTLFFRTQHTSVEPSVGVMVQAKLDLDPKLALEITDDAYAYLKEAFLKKGYKVGEIDKEAFKNTNEVKKADKRGEEQWLINGSTVELNNKKLGDKYITAHATGVNFCPIIRRTIIGTFDTKVASTVAFVQVINFADPSAPKKKGRYLGSPIITPSLMLDPGETICGTGGFGFWNAKIKGGSVSFPVNSDIRWQGYSWLAGTKDLDEPNTQLWLLNRDEFKKAVLELSKAQIDQYITEYIKAITP